MQMEQKHQHLNLFNLDNIIVKLFKMNKKYINPDIKVENINFDDILETSIPFIKSDNEEDLISDKSEILVNTNSVWDN